MSVATRESLANSTSTPEAAPVDGAAEASGPRRRTLWKRRLLRGADIAGLGFLSPVIRLASWEEPRRQLREIGRLIVIPIAAFLLFLGAWTALAPKHKTKSGEVPTPAVVWDAARNIWTFHQREGDKEQAFLMEGPRRGEQLAAVVARISELAPYETATAAMVARESAQRETWLAEQVAPLQAERDALAAVVDDAARQRRASMTALGAAADQDPSSVAARDACLTALREDLQATEREKAELAAWDARIAEANDRKYPPLQEARRLQTLIAEEKQYLAATADLLGKANRAVRYEREVERLRESQRRLLRATGPEVAEAAEAVVRAEARLESIAASSYAKPWTLPMQIARSVACAFCGFMMGTAVAIPVGILCGLSRTFMAAVTPFIALFRPVSPIVWLPIALIVVGGFVPDPDKHWLTQLLDRLPLIGWMKINPAFIASAATVALCSLWATMVNTALGVSCVERDHLNVARVLRLGFWGRLFKIIIPSALPLIFAGLRISLGVGWMVLIAGELLSSSEGIGKFVWDQFNNGASDSFAKMIVVVFVVGVIGLLLDRAMVVLQRLFSFEESQAVI